MQALLQRVSTAQVSISNKVIGAIAKGLLVFLAIEKNDSSVKTDRLLHRILNYRIFSDDNDRMNLSVKDIQGSILAISQFTLAANTTKGMRPSFSAAAPPELGEKLYNYFVIQAEKQINIQTGKFGADMQVTLCNDGPVTILLKT